MTNKPSHAVRRITPALTILLAALNVARAETPGAEKLLPSDTLFIASVPDYLKFRAAATNAPAAQLWRDAEMRPFREKLMTKWNDEFVVPLERELGIKFEDYAQLLQGQVTVALTQNGWGSDPSKEPGAVLMVDVKQKSDELKKRLEELRKKWGTDPSKKVRTEKLGNHEFSVLTLSSNDIPKTLKKFLPRQLEYHEAGEEPETDKPAKEEVIIGQAESLLLVADSLPVVEKLVARLSGGSAPCIGDQAEFQASQQGLFRDAHAYAWLNAKAIFEMISREAAKAKENADSPNPLEAFSPAKLLSASGLSGLKTIGLALNRSSDGMLLHAQLGVPESARSGLFKILPGEPKESVPPAFVPADVLKFQRWRLDGQKTWAALEKMMTQISPQTLNGLNFLIETANTSAREKDPGFDLRKNLIGNLGDDLISYEKPPRGGEDGSGTGGESLFLIGSPNADTLAASIKTVLVFITAQAGAPAEREFLGRKIFSVPLPAMPFAPGGPGTAPSRPRTLHYAASGGYVAFSTDTGMLEEYLRSSEAQGKSLRDLPGLTEAAQKVTGPGSSLLGFENDSKAMRTIVETLKKSPNAAKALASLRSLSGAAGFAAPDADLSSWLDFSLLPDYDKISKYFYFSVGGLSATTDGISYKMFAPTPPELRASQASKP
jgi:hypothetical protein